MARKHPKIKGGYMILPYSTIKCIQYKSLKPHTRVVYHAILTQFIRDNKINPDNLVKIAHSQMETLSGVSHGSVVRAVKELKAYGFMKTKIPGGINNPSTFQLNGRFLNTGSVEASW